MNSKLNAKSLMKRFAADQKGTVAAMLAIAAVPLFIAAGAAIDFVRLTAAQTHVQAALDASALAAASMKDATDAERIAYAGATFDLNVKQGAAASLEPTAAFQVIEEKIVSTASLQMPTAFMSLAGIDMMNGSSQSEVGIILDKKAEVVLVLDYSGSMGEEAGGSIKYEAMRDAASALVEDLEKTDPDKVKFGLVPFSHHVYTTLPSGHVLGASGSTWTGCTQDRQYPANVSASTPTGDTSTQWNQPMAPDHAAWGCDGYIANNLKTVDLTDNAKIVSDQLAIMKPYAWTHIALGVEFGYHMLSPNAPYTNGVAFNDKGTQKFMVVLTDGMQTEPAFGPGGSRNVAHGEANLEKLCESAKAEGITIITLAFDLDDTTTRKRLQDCATDPDKDFMVADSSADLATAFESVKAAITAEIYFSK